RAAAATTPAHATEPAVCSRSGRGVRAGSRGRAGSHRRAGLGLRPNRAGTGTTIVAVSPHGTARTFATIDAAHLPGACPGGVGLTTALAVLRSGWVIVGSLPTTDGTPATIGAGCLLILDSSGAVRETLFGHGINGPWDMTALDHGTSADLFVTNVLNGTVAAGGTEVDQGTVLRLHLDIDRHERP